MKKNTLLHLDADLVERAKKENINISRLTDETLKQALEIERPRTAQEHLRKLLAKVGSESSFYGETYFLPFQIESLKLTKVGLFDNFEAHFQRDSINVIYGSCGSGKSTIIRAILFAFGIKHRYFTDIVFNDGAITLRLFPNGDSISITGMDGAQNYTRGYQCLIADDSLERLTKNMIVPFFAELKDLGIQVIITASLVIDASQLSNDAHIIPL
jgi:post-segregation antitoxin (ccd killing protein)